MRRDAIVTLLAVYNLENTITPTKTRILSALTKLCKKTLPIIPGLNIDWQPLWSEILSYVHRENASKAICAPTISNKHFEKLISFTHNSRQYFSAYWEVILETAMKSLADVRLPTCVEGLLLLVTCLPTQLPPAVYNAYLPKWAVLWGSVTHNSYWDCCWLTLLTRARKYVDKNDKNCFEWQNLTPLLFTKARELLQLPTAESGKTASPQHAEYPHTFPSQYLTILTLSADAKRVALNKLAKILYFLTFQSEISIPAEMILVTSPSIMKDSAVPIVGFNTPPNRPVKNVSVEFVMFLQSVRPFLYPSNNGNWTGPLAYFITTFVVQMTRHVGRSVADGLLGPDESACPFPHCDVVTVQYIMGSLVPLLVEGLYGKNPMMSQFCAMSLKCLLAIDPNIGDVLVPFFLSALDVTAVNQSHQGQFQSMFLIKFANTFSHFSIT